MISPNNNTWALLALVLAGFLPGGILARECHATPNSSSNVNSNALIVSTPDDLRIFHGCTTILGDILIGSTYNGSFVLNGVETITGSVSTEDSDSDLSGLTAIEMPDLLYTESISLPRSRELMNLHLPRLKHIKNLSFTQGIEDASFDLGSLETADEISMTGYWSSVSLPSLETINSLTITDLRLSRRTADIDTDHSNPLTISLPSLTEAHHIRTNGLQTRPRISSPLLEAGIINPQLSIGVEDKYKDKNNFNP
ncbi:hypothetical protein BJX61DRAFT_489622 [Aspergillus egyptiacus]|nr:hypothetical protein BJX61DRAFT_489622 [Aspergillus egyptiacus]